MGLLTSRDILGRLSGDKIGDSVKKELRKTMETGYTRVAKEKFARQISGKGKMGREREYKKFGISRPIKGKIEKALTAAEGPSCEDQKALAKKSEMTRKRNVFLSRRSAEEAAGYETTSERFVGGAVETRTMTGGGNDSNDSNGKQFALGGASSSSGSSFALGGKNSSKNNNGKQGALKNGSPFGLSSRSGRGVSPGQGISPGQGNPANQGTPMPPRNPLI